MFNSIWVEIEIPVDLEVTASLITPVISRSQIIITISSKSGWLAGKERLKTGYLNVKIGCEFKFIQICSPFIIVWGVAYKLKFVVNWICTTYVCCFWTKKSQVSSFDDFNFILKQYCWVAYVNLAFKDLRMAPANVFGQIILFFKSYSTLV